MQAPSSQTDPYSVTAQWLNGLYLDLLALDVPHSVTVELLAAATQALIARDGLAVSNRNLITPAQWNPKG